MKNLCELWYKNAKKKLESMEKTMRLKAKHVEYAESYKSILVTWQHYTLSYHNIR